MYPAMFFCRDDKLSAEIIKYINLIWTHRRSYSSSPSLIRFLSIVLHKKAVYLCMCKLTSIANGTPSLERLSKDSILLGLEINYLLTHTY